LLIPTAGDAFIAVLAAVGPESESWVRWTLLGSSPCSRRSGSGSIPGTGALPPRASEGPLFEMVAGVIAFTAG
jgi:hypothetical protein